MSLDFSPEQLRTFLAFCFVGLTFLLMELVKMAQFSSSDHPSLHKESSESAQCAAGSGGGLKPLLRLSWELLAITALFKKANMQTY